MAIAVSAALQGKRVLWGAPTYDQVRIGWGEADYAAGRVANFLESKMWAEFPGGGRITFRSLDDPDNARGHTADLMVIDEAADVAERAWYEVCRPMLMDTGGDSWIGGTPKGRNWFWREHMEAADRPDSMAWQTPTLGVEITANGLVRRPHPLENPDIPFAEVQRMWATMPERSFRQEVLAEFVEDAGGVFRGVTACVAGEIGAPYVGEFVMGVDWAKSHDFTVLTVLDVQRMRVVDWDRFNQVDWALQRARLRAMHDRWQCRAIVAERNSMGEPNIEALQREGLPVQGFTTTNASKTEIIERLVLLIEQRGLSFPDIPQLVSELQAYEMERLPSGTTRYGAPEGMFDDCVMSLALAVWGAGQSMAPLHGKVADEIRNWRGL